MKPSKDISRLIEIMAALRAPVTGCPWDVEQTFSTIAPYTIEEAYEVADAIERKDLAALKDELGDLLLQVVFHSRIAEEAGHFRLVLDKVIDVVGHAELGQHITGEKFTFRLNLLAAANLGDDLSRHLNGFNQLRKA